MADEVKKGADQASGQDGVDKGADGSAAKELSAEDIVALTEALKMSLEREAKTAEERDNYKEGMLKAKGKLKSDEGEEGNGADAGKTDKGASSSELVDVVKALLKQNQEITVAAVNRSQIATAGQGGSSEAKVDVGDNMFSASQLKELKAKGWDDKKIARLKQNILNSRS